MKEEIKIISTERKDVFPCKSVQRLGGTEQHTKFAALNIQPVPSYSATRSTVAQRTRKFRLSGS
jgi:hypothetical protein